MGKMLRATLRVICVFLLVTIIIDVTNSKCFNKSLTFKYSKQFGAIQCGEVVVNKFTQLRKRVRSNHSWKNSYRTLKPYIHTTYIWLAFLIRNTCLFVQHLRSYIDKSPSRHGSKSFIPRTQNINRTVQEDP